jgi:hypothetical protein
MSRLGVNYETVKKTAVSLLSQGLSPSVQKIRETLGTGSNTTIAEHLKIWREEHAKKAIHHLPSGIPSELISPFEVLWQMAMEQAQNQLIEYKKTIESDRETMLQVQKEAERYVADLKQKLTETSTTLENERVEKQKLNIELAITQDRLEKQDAWLITQKTQQEDRLKRIYEEKDNISVQCCQLQNEVKALQEKLEAQGKQHQNLIFQQNILHEQSENRWLTLIDRAREETKETNKKLELLRRQSDDKINKAKEELLEHQRNVYKKDAQTKDALKKNNQLNQDIPFSGSKNVKKRSFAMRLEERGKPKKVPISTRKNTKKTLLKSKANIK